MEVLNIADKILSRCSLRRQDLRLMEKMVEAFSHPYLCYPTVHVAGTNGKGQVSAKIAHTLYQAGYKVGLFISPHLFDYRERITINGTKIPLETLIKYDKELSELSLEPNFFECSTLYGFRHFKDQKVDIAVIETGLGGQLDATNVIHPLVSIITSISNDHTEFLGTTVEEIAEQKAGIIKPKIPVVVGPRAKYLPIFNKAKELNAPLSVIEKKLCFYDSENQAVANEALSILKKQFPFDAKALEKGMKYSLPCRFEKRGNVIYDVAHNYDGFTRLIGALSHFYPYRKFRFLIGMSRRKDIKGCLEQIKEIATHVHFVQADQKDAASTEEIGAIFESLTTCPYSMEESISSGVKRAKGFLAKDEILVVCGSFYIMREAYE